MVRRRDSLTLDLFEDYTPPDLIQRYDEVQVRACSLEVKISRAVSQTLKDCDLPRDVIAERMSTTLGKTVSKNMLDAYASQARDASVIPYDRLLALVEVTGDSRLLQMGAERSGKAVIDDTYLHWVEYGQASEKKEELSRIMDAARRNARKGARS
jgi:hypothetical protein